MWKEAKCEWNVNGCDERKNKLKNGKKENGTARGVVGGGVWVGVRKDVDGEGKEPAF